MSKRLPFATLVLTIAITISLVSPRPAVAATSTWGGGTSGSWSVAGNWSPSGVPASDPTTALVFGATSNATMTDDIAGTLTLNSMTFNAGGPAYTLTGNGLNFVSNGSTLPQVVSNSSNLVSLNLPVTLANNLSVSGSGNVAIGGAVGGNGSLTMSGSGTLTLSGGNSYLGGTAVQSGTVSVAADAALGAGNVTGGSAGTLAFTASTASTKSFAMGGGTITVPTGQTVTFNGGAVSSAVLDGSGTFAANGAQMVSVRSTAGVSVTSNNGADQFRHFDNSAAFAVAPGVNIGKTSTTVNLNGFTNQGLGSVTVGAQSKINVSNLQSYGTTTINPAAVTETFTQTTLVTNVGTTPLGFNGGSRTFIGTAATAVFPVSSPQAGTPTFVAGIDLNGKNAVVAGGLFVNNGYVEDSSNGFTGTSTVVADFGSLVKGAGFFQNTVLTQNGGKFQPGNSPGSASFGSFVLGKGGVSNYVFAIDDATGAAGPVPDAAGHVSGWGLVKAVDRGPSGAAPGNFTWAANEKKALSVSVQTLVNPTTVGTDVPGQMDHFDPNRAYSWPAVTWAGSYAGPTDVTALDASTSFDLSGFSNPVSGQFGWSLDLGGHTLSLTYSPSAVPEPGTLALGTFAALGLVYRRRRRQAARD